MVEYTRLTHLGLMSKLKQILKHVTWKTYFSTVSVVPILIYVKDPEKHTQLSTDPLSENMLFRGAPESQDLS